MASGNRQSRRKAAKAAGVKGQIVSQLVAIDETDEGIPYAAVAAAIVAGLKSVVDQGGDPFERSAITMGTDHPEHPGRIVIEVKTDRMQPRRCICRKGDGVYSDCPVHGNPAVLKLGAPIELVKFDEHIAEHGVTAIEAALD